MAKRARMTVDDVVQQCVDSNDYAECDYDPDEPVMEGSNDEFSDFEWDESDEDIDKGDLDTMHTPAAQVPPALLEIKSWHGAPPSSG